MKIAPHLNLWRPTYLPIWGGERFASVKIFCAPAQSKSCLRADPERVVMKLTTLSNDGREVRNVYFFIGF